MPATSKAQQQAAAIALHAPKSQLKGASKQMAKMSKADLEKFASTKHAGLPKHKKKEELMEKLREFIRKTVQECMMELQEDMSALDIKGVAYSPQGKKMKYEGACPKCGDEECQCEGKEEGKKDLNNPYSEESEGTYQERYTEAVKADKPVYKLPPSVNKQKEPTDPKAPAKQKKFTEPDVKKQKAFTEPDTPKKQKAFTKPEAKKSSPEAKPVLELDKVKEPPVKGVDDKFIVQHETGKKNEEDQKYVEKSVCPACNRPYTEDAKNKNE